MKIAVLLHWNEGEKSGVFKKVVSQIKAWKSHGASVSLHLISRRPRLEVWQKHLGSIPITFHLYQRWNRLRVWQSAVKATMAMQPDIVYHRYDLYMPALQRLAQIMPMILEINTEDVVEYCLRGRLRCWYNLFTRSLLLREAAGLVFVTEELSRSPHFRRYPKPFTVVANGIDLEDYPLLLPAKNEEPRLVFLATSGHSWHGLDKVIRMAQYFPTWRFDIIGIKREEFHEVSPNVFLHGPLDRQAYEFLLAQADVAIGTLALHRKRMNEGCPLKVREYLAYGLPVIIGGKDSDFPQGAPFICELNNTEDNIERNIKAIKTFVERWKGKRVPREAVTHIDNKVKEAQRLAFFSSVLGR